MHAISSMRAFGIVLSFVLAWLLGGCAAVNTFPTAARAGDTISVMVGGSEHARKETIGAVLTDVNGGMWDLQALGLVRSVFNLRADGRAHGMHYSSFTHLNISWEFGHEPVQTVLIADLPPGVPPGAATLEIRLNVSDNSSGIADPFQVRLEVLAGSGAATNFARKSGSGPVPADLQAMEPAPHAKLTFAPGVTLGAASLVVDVDQAVVNLDDLNVYSPEATVRGSFSATGAFGDKQRQIYWRHDGDRLYIDIVAPQGIDGRYLQAFILHPRGLAAAPGFSLLSSAVYDVNGQLLSTQPQLAYYPQ